jgi:PAS domain S-box-containing protein
LFYAVIKGVFTFLFLFSLLVLAAIFYDFSGTNMHSLGFILGSALIILLSNQVYDAAINEYQVKRRSEKLAETMVESSQKLFLEVYENSPVAYMVVNELGTVVSVNTAAARLFGHPAEKLVKGNLFKLLGAGDSDHQSVIRQKFEQGIVIADEEVKIKRDKNISWTKLSTFRFSGTAGERLTLVTIVDVTKQKEIDTAKSEFVSLASHQLRTPISGMRWSAELLLMDGVETLSPQQKKYIDRLLTSIKRMSSLVDDFLQVSRFDLGTRVLKLEEVSPAELVDDVLGEQTEVIISKRLKISKLYDPDIVAMRTDLGLLRMIVTNLTTNAIKYSRVGGEVTITFNRKGEEFELMIEDTGMGIPIADQPRIFSKVFRATNATKEVPDGTGLGLYIVKRAVESMRGRISFTSVENEGTTFTAVLPFNL